MRWDIIDSFQTIQKGRLSRSIKAFSGSEDFFAEHYPGRPLVPEPLFIEMIAQTGGVLFGLGLGFQKEVVLAKIDDAEFFRPVAPPCSLEIEAVIDEEREDGARISGVVSMNGETVAKGTILLAAVDTLGDPEHKIVFNDGFLKHYDIHRISEKSGSMA